MELAIRSKIQMKLELSDKSRYNHILGFKNLRCIWTWESTDMYVFQIHFEWSRNRILSEECVLCPYTLVSCQVSLLLEDILLRIYLANTGG